MKIKLLDCILIAVLFGIAGLLISFSRAAPAYETHYIGADAGGDVFGYMQKYGEWNEAGDHVKVDGICASACTFMFGKIPMNHICATPTATFGFHGVYSGFSGFNQEMTNFINGYIYPKSIADIVRTKYDWTKGDVDKDLNPTGLVWFTGADLGVPECADAN